MSYHHRMNKLYYLRHLSRDFVVVVLSIILAFVLYKTGVITGFIEATSFSRPITAFISGMFFTFVFTVVPAGVALANVSETYPPLYTAFFGALGAICVDMFILHFVRRGLVKDVSGLARTTLHTHVLKLFHFGFLKWIAFVSAMLLLATPLPDEPGLFLLGISKVKSKFLPLLFFVAHFVGILAIISIAGSFDLLFLSV